LLRIQTAELILDIDPGLLAKIDELFAVDVQFASQGIDPNFLSLQARLLYDAGTLARSWWRRSDNAAADPKNGPAPPRLLF
jgi:hypothetical protein